MRDNVSPIEALWLLVCVLGIRTVVYLARDELLDAVAVFSHPNEYNPHRLKQAFLNLGVVALMVSVLLGFSVIGISAMLQPQVRAAPIVSPVQLVITIALFAILGHIVALSLYWRWMRRLYVEDEKRAAAAQDAEATPAAYYQVKAQPLTGDQLEAAIERDKAG